jgi:hypothetical protein
VNWKAQVIGLIEANAREQVAVLAGQLVRASSEEKEDILAEPEFQRWLADECRDSASPTAPRF